MEAPRRAIPDGNDLPGALVAQDHRLLEDERPNRPLVDVVEIGAADAHRLHRHADVAVGRVGRQGLRMLLEDDLVDAAQDRGGVAEASCCCCWCC